MDAENQVARGKNPERPRPYHRGFDLEERLLQYSARIIGLVDVLPRSRTGNHVAGQLLRSGTSPLSNQGEASSAESIDDLIHKLSICLKELRETRRWLLLIQRVPMVKSPSMLDAILGETDELIRIFAASIRTSRAKQADSRRASSTGRNSTGNMT